MTVDTILSVSSSHRWPAEWEPHQACLLLYPHSPYTFRSNCLPAQAEVLNVARTIVRASESSDSCSSEDVLLFCKDTEQAVKLKEELMTEEEEETSGGRIHVLVCPSDDTWARDTGPTFLLKRERTMHSSNSSSSSESLTSVVGLDWDFNAYGGPEEGCYWPCELDKAVCKTMCRELALHYNDEMYASLLPTRKIPIVLEGGSIHTDGQGTILTTEECLLHANRNPHLSKLQIEAILLESLGCNKVIWLPLGLAGDKDTNGHVDNMACFVRPTEIVLSWTDDEEKDPDNYQRCRSAMDVLTKEVDAQGRELVVHKLYLPPPMYYTAQDVETLTPFDGIVDRSVGQRLAASYVNFYIANTCVVVPQFGEEPYDTGAIRVLQPLFLSRRVVGVPSREILLGGGNVHCITQQLPKLQ